MQFAVQRENFRGQEIDAGRPDIVLSKVKMRSSQI